MTFLLWILAILGSLAGGLVLVASIFLDSAPKQGAAAALACGLAVPYVLARAASELPAAWRGDDEGEEEDDEDAGDEPAPPARRRKTFQPKA